MFICKICNNKFKNSRSLINHLRFKHNLVGKEYYDLYYKKPNEGKCLICKKPTKFINIIIGYKEGCCLEHTNIIRYGKDYAKRSQETREKISKTVKSKECQDKIKLTNLEKYGVERYINIKKAKQTCLEKYGVDNPSKAQEVKDKISNVLLTKSTEEKKDIIKKRKETCLEKYGVEVPIQNHSIYNKIKETCLEKYGFEYASQSDIAKEKFKKTCLEKYGTICPANYNNQEKSKKTRLDKYGNENYNNIQQIWLTRLNNIKKIEKKYNCTLKTTLINRYGQGWLSIENTLEHIYMGSLVFILNKDINKINEYNELNKNNHISHKEKNILEYIKSIYNGKILENVRNVIPPKELDIYIPEKRIAIEFNGIYWHSSLHGTPKNYHFEKSKACEEKGIRLIHIYEWELNDPYWSKIKMMLNQALNNNSTIYARNCEIKEITNVEAKELNERVHLQGHRHAQVTYGLFYNNTLVQLMSFSKTRYNRNLKSDNEWEIIRGCPGSNISVVGGVSKLFKHFIKEYNPEKVFSYCDFNKFDGNSYEKIGMKFIGYTGPDKTWIMPDNSIVKRNPFKYKELKKEARSIMWGSGSKKYEWNNILEVEKEI